MDKKYLIGIDLGTSSVKTLMIDSDGEVLSLSSQEYDFSVPQPGWAELDPRDWLEATLGTLRLACQKAGVNPHKIAAIGLTGQMHGMVCLDAAGNPVRPAILWPDQRSGVQVDQVYQRVGKASLGEWTANPVAAGFMLSSWLWVLEHEVELAAKTAHLLLPKDYLRWKFTGAFGTEPSDASATLLFDTANRCWCQPLLDTLEIDPGLLPPVHDSSQVAGFLTDEIARAAGLPSGIPVIYGGSDQGMQALGNGLLEGGTLSCAISTGGQLVMPMGSPTYDEKLRTHTFCHVLPGQWLILAATLSAGLSLKWLRDQVFRSTSYQELAEIAQGKEDASGLLFLPHLAGERTPYMDPGSRAGFWGLSLHHDRGHMVRAVMEGVVFSLRQCLELIQGLGLPVDRVIASGGGTRHPLWTRLLADIFNQPILTSQWSEASALGAAMLAGVGTGVFTGIPDAAAKCFKWSQERVDPDPAKVDRYQQQYSRFLELYPALRYLSK